MKETISNIYNFVNDRDWWKFRTPDSLAKSISIEAAELLECFQWNNDEFNQEAVKEELADVMIYCIQMSLLLGVDMETIINDKMNKNIAKYPIEKSKGKTNKYNAL